MLWHLRSFSITSLFAINVKPQPQDHYCIDAYHLWMDLLGWLKDS